MGLSSPPSIIHCAVNRDEPPVDSAGEEGRGVTLKGGETGDSLPMNPEGVEVDVSQGLHRLTNVYVS